MSHFKYPGSVSDTDTDIQHLKLLLHITHPPKRKKKVRMFWFWLLNPGPLCIPHLRAFSQDGHGWYFLPCKPACSTGVQPNERVRPDQLLQTPVSAPWLRAAAALAAARRQPVPALCTPEPRNQNRKYTRVQRRTAGLPFEISLPLAITLLNWLNNLIFLCWKLGERSVICYLNAQVAGNL